MRSGDADARRAAVQMTGMRQSPIARARCFFPGLRDADPTVAAAAAHGLNQVGELGVAETPSPRSSRATTRPPTCAAPPPTPLREIGGETAQRFAALIATTASPLRHGHTDYCEFEE